MKNLIAVCAVVLLVLTVSSHALAQSLPTSAALVPSTLDVTPGSTVDISVYLVVSSPITMTAISTDILYDKNIFDASTVYDPIWDMDAAVLTQGDFLTHAWDLLGAQTTTLRIGGFDMEGSESLAAGSGTLFTFTLKVKDDAQLGTYELTWGDAGNGVGFDYGDENFADVILPSSGASINVIPEPITIALLGLGGLMMRKRK